MTLEELAAAEKARVEGAQQRFNGHAREEIPLTWLCDCDVHAEAVYLVPDLLSQGGLAVIFGPPNAGKSTIALDLAFAIAHGAPWRNLQTQQGLVLYLGGEGRIGVERRLCALRKQHPDLRGGSLTCDWNVPNFRDPEAVQALIARTRRAESAAGEKCALLVIDTLSRHIYGSDNDPEQMAAFIAACDAIRRETGCAILVVHHTGKDAARGARGHSSLLGACDTEIEVTDEVPHWLKVTKQRDGERLPPLAFNFNAVHLGRDVTGRDITAVTIEHSDQAPPRREPKGEKQLLVFEELERLALGGQVGWTQKQIADIAVGLKVSRTQSFMMGKRLLEGGFLKQSIGGLMLA